MKNINAKFVYLPIYAPDLNEGKRNITCEIKKVYLN